MAFTNLLVEDRGAVRIITLNRPEKLNALNRATVLELDAAFAAAGGDTGVRVVVLTGAGPKAFVAGADIAEMSESATVCGCVGVSKGQIIEAIHDRGVSVGLR